MSKNEKFTIGAVLVALIASFTLYGVWEDKVWLFAPLVVLIYAALAVRAVGALRRGAGSSLRREGPEAGSRPNVSGSSFRYEREEGREYRSKEDEFLASNLRPPTPSFKPSSVLQTPNSQPQTAPLPHSSTSQLPPAGIPLFLFWLFSAVMIPFSVIPYEAKISTLRLGCYVGTYWAVALICSRFPRRKVVWMTLLGFLILTALYSIAQHKVAPEIIFGMKRYTRYWLSGVGGRLGGTYQCPNHIAHLFQMWIPFCLLFLFLPQFGWFWRICVGYSIPLFTVLIYQTQSRAGLLGLVTGLAVTALLLILRKSQRLFYISLVVVPLLGAGAIGGLWAGSEMFRDRMQPVVEVVTTALGGDFDAAASVDFRPMTWLDSLEMVKERPWVGVGPGNYGQTFPEYRYRVKARRMETVHPHNEYVEMLTEYGWVGAGLVAWVLIRLSISMVRLIKTSNKAYHALPAIALLAALAGTAVHGFFDFELRIFPNAMMLAVLAGCAVAPLLQSQRDPAEKGKESFTTANARGASEG